MSVRLRGLAAPMRSVTAAAVLAGLAGCGGGKTEDAAQPQVTATSTPKPVVAPTGLVPTEQADAFTGLRRSAAQLTDAADRIALGVDRPGDDRGVADTRLARLLTDLRFLLTEHVYLTGVAVQTAFERSDTSQAAKDALAALDANSEAFATMVVKGRLEADDPDKGAFLEGWRAHAQSFFDYAVAVKDDDAAERGKAEAALDAYRVSAADYLAEITDGKLPGYQVKAEMKEHINTLKDAIDAFAADDTQAYDLLKIAGDAMAKTAGVFAKGLYAEDSGQAAELEEPAVLARADLTGLTISHTYLTASAFIAGFGAVKGFTTAPYAAAKVAIEDNSKQLAQVIRGATTSEAQVEFLEDWRRQFLDLEEYAKGAANDNRRVMDGALDYLDDDQKNTGKFIDELTKGRAKAEDVSAALERHLRTFTGTVDAMRALFVRSRSS